MQESTKKQLREEFIQGYSPAVKYGGIKDENTLIEMSNYWLSRLDIILVDKKNRIEALIWKYEMPSKELGNAKNRRDRKITKEKAFQYNRAITKVLSILNE